MKNAVENQIRILKIIDIILAALLIITSYAVYQSSLQSNAHKNVIKGKFNYLSASEPDNPKIGVFLRLHLEFPRAIDFSNTRANRGLVVISTSNGTVIAGIAIYTARNNTDGRATLDIIDNNKDGALDSGDILHIYGTLLNNCTISLSIEGINGNISIRIPNIAKLYIQNLNVREGELNGT